MIRVLIVISLFLPFSGCGQNSRREAEPLNVDSVLDCMNLQSLLPQAIANGSLLVVFRVNVDSAGFYKEHIVKNAPNDVFRQAAEQCIHLIQFEPARDLRGNRISAWVDVPIELQTLQTRIELLDAPPLDLPDTVTASTIRVDSVLTPTVLNRSEIEQCVTFPDYARKAELHGRVSFRILVDSSGHYIRHMVLRNPHPWLTQAYERCLPQIRFSRQPIQNSTYNLMWVVVSFDADARRR